MSVFTFCLWKHWFWITAAAAAMKAMKRQPWSIYVTMVLLCQAQLAMIATAAPVGAVDTKGITFKKFALNEEAKGGSDKPNLPMVAAASMVGGGRKVMRITLGGNDSPEDAVGEVMDGHEEISRIFVTLPTTTTTTIKSLTTSNVESLLVSSSLSTTGGGGEVTSEMSKTEDNSQVITTDDKVEVISGNDKEREPLEVSSIEPNAIKDTDLKDNKGDATMAKLVQAPASVNTTPTLSLLSSSDVPSETEASNGLASIPGISIEESVKKVDDTENIQNLVLQDEETDTMDAGESNANRSRKSKGLTDNQINTRSTGDEEIEASNPEARLQPESAQNLNRSPNLLIQFSDSDKMELLNSQNHALTSDDLSRTTRSSNFGLISGISFSVLALFCAVSLVGAMMYRRRYINKPQTLSEPDSSGYIDDSIIRENSDEMYSLDNDSFLNSLEAMTIQNYWTDNVKHTKL